jgi:hypothetical protein
VPTYGWVNKKTGEYVEVHRPLKEYDVPPTEEDEWERVFSFGVGRVEGGGSSPSRPSVSTNKQRLGK